MNVYFVSGMSANCKVFDKLELPEGFVKRYIEWIIPREDESLDEYVHDMAKDIDRSQPFILIGYSFGGVIVQEMNKFLSPLKTIIIASIKNEEELSPFLHIVQKMRLAERLPLGFFHVNGVVSDFLAEYVYGVRPEDTSEYVSYTDPVYTKWSLHQILNWKPEQECPNLYHIHGTRDQMFPLKYIKATHVIEGGDHLMVLKRFKKISKELAEILLE